MVGRVGIGVKWRRGVMGCEVQYVGGRVQMRVKWGGDWDELDVWTKLQSAILPFHSGFSFTIFISWRRLN